MDNAKYKVELSKSLFTFKNRTNSKFSLPVTIFVYVIFVLLQVSSSVVL